MKTIIFANAIQKRQRIKFLYELNENIIDPYYLSIEKNGNKVLYGRNSRSNEIKKFEFKRIANIKVFENINFSPVIPIILQAS